MTNERFEAIAARYDAIVSELRVAAAHGEDCARHFRDGDVPRGCAHAFALEGHLRNVLRDMEALSIEHAAKATPANPPQ